MAASSKLFCPLREHFFFPFRVDDFSEWMSGVLVIGRHKISCCIGRICHLILVSGCPRCTIVKQNDISISCINEKEKIEICNPEFAQVRRQAFLYLFNLLNMHFVCV